MLLLTGQNRRKGEAVTVGVDELGRLPGAIMALTAGKALEHETAIEPMAATV
jgi:hypothetical protein